MTKLSIVWENSELKSIIDLCAYDIFTQDDIEHFLKHIISNVSAETKIPQDHIMGYNKSFYDYLNQIFKETSIISSKCSELEKLCSMFKVPAIKNNLRSENEMILGDVKESKRKEITISPTKPQTKSNSDKKVVIKQSEHQSTHIDCLKLFANLSTDEKIKFIMKLQNTEITITASEILNLK